MSVGYTRSGCSGVSVAGREPQQVAPKKGALPARLGDLHALGHSHTGHRGTDAAEERCQSNRTARAVAELDLGAVLFNLLLPALALYRMGLSESVAAWVEETVPLKVVNDVV